MRTYVFIFILVALQSCGLPYCKKHKFSEDDVKWVNMYNINDTILFYSSDNNEDTLIVKNKNMYNPLNTFLFDCRGCNWMEGDNEFYAISSINFVLLHNGNKYDGRFAIEKTEKDLPAKILLSLGGLYSKDYLNVYNNCVTLDRDNNAELGIYQDIIDLKKISYSKENGITTYQTISGRVYTKE